MTSKRSPREKTLSSSARQFFRGRDDILDIILFGSAARKKTDPGDIDVLVIFKEHADLGVLQQLRRALAAHGDVQVIGKTWTTLLDPAFNAREAILAEGRSLLRNERIAAGFGYEPRVLFRYDITPLTKTNRMRFYYALHGRGSDGVLKHLDATRFADNVLLCPITGVDEMRQFLTTWHMTFTEMSMLVPARLKGLLSYA